MLSTVSKIILFPFWAIFLYLFLETMGLSAMGATVIGGTGILGIVLGLAFKGIAENYLAGILLATRSPFTKGDLIRVNDFEGYVQNLNMRGTTIIDLDGNLILIPNLTVIQSVVENRTANPNTRTSFYVDIDYHESITKVQDLIVECVKDVKGVLSDPAPNVIVDELGISSVRLRVLVWFNVKISNEPRFRSRCMIQIKEFLLANGVTFPDSNRELIIRDSVKVQLLQPGIDQNAELQEKKNQIKKKASENLQATRDSKSTEDLTGYDLVKLADANPLPMNSPRADLLKPEDT